VPVLSVSDALSIQWFVYSDVHAGGAGRGSAVAGLERRCFAAVPGLAAIPFFACGRGKFYRNSRQSAMEVATEAGVVPRRAWAWALSERKPGHCWASVGTPQKPEDPGLGGAQIRRG
jgi:hypothetical protein